MITQKIHALLGCLLCLGCTYAQEAVRKNPGNNGLTEDLALPSGKTLTISSGAKLTVEEGAILEGLEGGGGGLTNVASTITGGTVTLAGTLGGNITWTFPAATDTFAGQAWVAAGYQPLDSDLTSLAAMTTTSFGRALLELANADALRTSAGLVIGTDVQAYNEATTFLGSSIDLTTEVTGALPVANGGTGATNPSNARSNLGLTIGTHVLAPTGDGSGLTSLNANALSSGTVAAARLGSGTANNTTFLRGDGTWSVPAGSGGGITDLTGDVTASGTGSVTATLANTAVTPGTYAPMAATVDGKGRITSASSIPLDFPEGLPTMAVDLIDGAMHGIQFLYNAEYPDPPSLDYQRAWVVAGPGVDQRRIILPSVEGTLALTSDLPQSAVVDVHKNGTDQTGLGNGSWVTVTFSTEASDTGSDFSSNALMVATGERWILEVVVKTLQAHNANLVQVAVYRNGSFHKLLSAGASYASGASYGGSVILHEGGNYDIRAHSPSGQALSVSGTIGETWLKAIRVK